MVEARAPNVPMRSGTAGGLGRVAATSTSKMTKKIGQKRSWAATELADAQRLETSTTRRKVEEEMAVPALPAVPVAETTEVSSELMNLETIIISLERRPDRLEGCLKRLQTECAELPCSLFKATDGRETIISEEEVSMNWNTARNVDFQRIRATRKGWNDLETYQVRQLDLSPGERGCSSSHIRAWRHCLESAGDTDKPLLVLEDDAAPTPEFRAILCRALKALPSDADVLYLGYSQAADWRREITEDLVEAEYLWTTVGYIVWPKGARLLLSQLPVNEPVDNWMAGLCAENSIKAYAVRPKIVRQADAWNVNSDVHHSDENYWGPNSDIQHSDHLYWGPEDAKVAKPGTEIASGSCFWGIDSEDSEDSDL